MSRAAVRRCASSNGVRTPRWWLARSAWSSQRPTVPRSRPKSSSPHSSPMTARSTGSVRARVSTTGPLRAFRMRGGWGLPGPHRKWRRYQPIRGTCRSMRCSTNMNFWNEATDERTHLAQARRHDRHPDADYRLGRTDRQLFGRNRLTALGVAGHHLSGGGRDLDRAAQAAVALDGTGSVESVTPAIARSA
ncbi:hypothetical protein SPHINGOAX6_70428 [Sphingomonas sp. AX6]|nr:hypothetical protein SPHINGOAX6_70428 [Sphingomonas sp. AX6]